MLTVLGVDRVIAVDLQRPGQGGEACFFDNNVPLEAVVTTDKMIKHFISNVPLSGNIVVVSPNSESLAKVSPSFPHQEVPLLTLIPLFSVPSSRLGSFRLALEKLINRT